MKGVADGIAANNIFGTFGTAAGSNGNAAAKGTNELFCYGVVPNTYIFTDYIEVGDWLSFALALFFCSFALSGLNKMSPQDEAQGSRKLGP